MQEAVEQKFARMRQVLNLQRPNRMPCGDIGFVEYRPDVYHLGAPEFAVKPGEVGVSRDGKKRYTRDGGVWAVGDQENYKDYNDVLNVDFETFEVEEVGSLMLSEMARLFAARARTHFPVPWHYGTLITRATIEFGWEPFLMASALAPKKFGAILDRFGQASLSVIRGWTEVEGTELITIHDDIACTRGVIMKPQWYREYVFPWYRRIFDAIHEKGRKALYVSDGNYTPVLEDILKTNPDGLYIESTSMGLGEFMHRAGKDKLFLIKSDSRNIDFGTPEEIYKELKMLRELHQEFPGMMIYRGGGNPKPGNVEAFNRYFRELLVYD
ncbi:MAG: uroporphyrinogen decarboxylase family protein [Candidatus Poribacteria bacterium]